jgi:hypothetical protein
MPRVVFIRGDAQHNEAIESVQKQTAHDIAANNDEKAHLDSLRSSREVDEQDPIAQTNKPLSDCVRAGKNPCLLRQTVAEIITPRFWCELPQVILSAKECRARLYF